MRTDAGRRGAIAGALVVALVAVVLRPSGAPASLGQDSPPASPVAPIGGASVGEVVIEVVGRILRFDDSVSLYGFVTHVAGLPPEDLFVDPAVPSAETARITFFGDADRLPDASIGIMTASTAVGSLEFYANPGAGASFEFDESFFSGQKIVVASARINEVLRGDLEDGRVLDLFVELGVLDTEAFSLGGGEPVTLGEPGARWHLTGAGRQLEPEADASRLVVDFAGRIVVAAVPVEASAGDADADGPDPAETPEDDGTPAEDDDESPPQRTPEDGDEDPDAGETDEPDDGETDGTEDDEEGTGTTADGIDADCDEVEAWLTATLGRVARTRALVSDVFLVLDDPDAEPLEVLDAGGVAGAAEELLALAEGQSDTEVPESVEEQHGSIVEALDEFAAAMDDLVSALDAEDEDAVADAADRLADAQAALAAASQPLADLARECGFRS